MKKMLILLVVFLMLVFCFISFCAAEESGTCGENLTWTLDNEGKLTISGKGAMPQFAYYYDSPWYKNSSIKSVVIENGVTNIGNFAFDECTNLERVTIPDSVTSIGDSVFFKCSSLEKVTIPSSVTNIGQLAFNYCTSLTDVKFQDSEAGPELKIWGYAFARCSSLKSITIPNRVKSIKEYTFSYCTSLQSVTIPSSVSIIERSVFTRCSSLQDINFCGTKAEWNAIEKDQKWENGSPSAKTIHYIAADGDGTQTNPYTIQTTDNWDTLSIAIGPALDTTGKYFKMDVSDSLSVSTMLGTQANPFKGTFDGNGKTLTLDLTNSSKVSDAPFAWINEATICNLHVDGKVTGTSNGASGLIGENGGVSHVINCHVSAELSGGKLIGGFCVGTGAEGEGIVFEGCVFDGKITGNEQFGGFVGWLGKNSNLQLNNCVSAPHDSSDKQKSGTFYYHDSSIATGATATLTNCYYLTALKDVQGKQVYTITKGQGVDIDYGTSKNAYTVSGITAYTAGLKYGNLFYAGKEDEVLLYPHCDVPTSKYARYYGNNVLLTRGVGDAWILTMPENNVTITARFDEIEAFGTPTMILPKGIKTIGKNAFAGIKAEIVYVPDEVKSISAYAFSNFTNLKQIRLPKDCVIDDAAFYGCTNLMAIYTSGDGTAKDWAKKNGFGVMTTK